MKTTFSKLILPMLVVVLAVTSAFKSVDDSLLIRPHEQVISSGVITDCIQKSQSCSLTVSGTFCRVGQIAGNPRLYDMNANEECVVPLYKP